MSNSGNGGGTSKLQPSPHLSSAAAASQASAGELDCLAASSATSSAAMLMLCHRVPRVCDAQCSTEAASGSCRALATSESAQAVARLQCLAQLWAGLIAAPLPASYMPLRSAIVAAPLNRLMCDTLPRHTPNTNM